MPPIPNRILGTPDGCTSDAFWAASGTVLVLGAATFYLQIFSVFAGGAIHNTIITETQTLAQMTTAELRGGVLQDVAMMGLRSAVGVIFIVHGYGKLVNPGFAFALENWGIPSSMHIPVALGELVPGILLLIGILTRISGGLLSIYMLGAIFLVKGAQVFAGDGPATEFDIILLAAALVAVVAGPGRISLSHAVKRLPRFIH